MKYYSAFIVSVLKKSCFFQTIFFSIQILNLVAKHYKHHDLILHTSISLVLILAFMHFQLPI